MMLIISEIEAGIKESVFIFKDERAQVVNVGTTHLTEDGNDKVRTMI